MNKTILRLAFPVLSIANGGAIAFNASFGGIARVIAGLVMTAGIYYLAFYDGMAYGRKINKE